MKSVRVRCVSAASASFICSSVLSVFALSISAGADNADRGGFDTWTLMNAIVVAAVLGVTLAFCLFRQFATAASLLLGLVLAVPAVWVAYYIVLLFQD